MSSKSSQFHPGELWPDLDGIAINAHGAGMLFDQGVYYWYGEHKTSGSIGNTAQVGVSCYSSINLTEWRNEGIVLSVVEKEGHDIERGSVIERPKVVYNRQTNKYVMWFHLELRGNGYASARCGVAVSETPTGPFVYDQSFRPNGQMSRDMTIFVDDDERAYLFCASEENQTMHIAELSWDYRHVIDPYVSVFENRSMEAPAVFKHNGKYYLIASGCTGWEPNEARSAVSDSIFGPWRELGNPCTGPLSDLTFLAQSTYVLPVHGSDGAFIFLADIWCPDNPIDGRYVWLPIQVAEDRFTIPWRETWGLDIFDYGAVPVASGVRTWAP